MKTPVVRFNHFTVQTAGCHCGFPPAGARARNPLSIPGVRVGDGLRIPNVRVGDGLRIPSVNFGRAAR